MVAKTEGDITYVDHADTEALKRKYAADPEVNVEELVTVDGVWGANTLLDCVGGDYDFVVASHVIEHVPDPAAFLAELVFSFALAWVYLATIGRYARVDHGRSGIDHEVAPSGLALGGIALAGTAVAAPVSAAALNPVVAGLCDDARDWRWSSYPLLVEGIAPEWVDGARVRAYLAAWGADLREVARTAR